jgi:hypothetical protein
MRLPPLLSKSAVGPSLTVFNGKPVIAFTGEGNNLFVSTLNLTPPVTSASLTGDPVAVTLIPAPGQRELPVHNNGSSPSIIAFGANLVIAWADGANIVHIAMSPDATKLWGNSVAFPSQPILPGTGPSVGSYFGFDDPNKVNVAVYWVGASGLMHFVLGDFHRPWSPVGTIAGETSFVAPGITTVPQDADAAGLVGAEFYGLSLLWAGTPNAAGQGKGVLSFETAPFGEGEHVGKHVYSKDQNGGADTTLFAPAVAYFPNGGPITVAYTGLDHFLYAFSGGVPPLPQVGESAAGRTRNKYTDTSIGSPAIAYDGNFGPDGEKLLYWAWTGTDGPAPYGSLNFQLDSGMLKAPALAPTDE